MPTTRSSSGSEAKYALIREYLNHPGITQHEFCRQHEISYSTFQRYLSKYRRQQSEQSIPVPAKSAGSFVPLTLSGLAQAAHNQVPCKLIWPDGLTIHFEESPSPEYLAALIRAGRSTSL